MNNTNELARAKKVFEDLCNSLDIRHWDYEKYDEALAVAFMAGGEDIPMSFIVMVDPAHQIIRLVSRLPFTVPEDKRVDVAIATCAASYALTDGNFDFDIEKGIVSFRLTASFRESDIGDGLFEYLVMFSGLVVDRFNDKFLALCKGIIDVDVFFNHE